MSEWIDRVLFISDESQRSVTEKVTQLAKVLLVRRQITIEDAPGGVGSCGESTDSLTQDRPLSPGAVIRGGGL